MIIDSTEFHVGKILRKDQIAYFWIGCMKSKSKYVIVIKPLVDTIAAGILLILTLPVMVFIAIILWFHGGSVLFRHKRPGYLGEIFVLVKFRTLSSGNKGKFVFGKFLRKTSLDELPQLWNVLKGEMSFVGPRPLLEEYMKLYTSEQHKRHAVKPGITGWAQVHGRNTLKLEKKVAMDIWYVENISFRTDFTILLKTMIQVFKWKESDYHAINPYVF